MHKEIAKKLLLECEKYRDVKTFNKTPAYVYLKQMKDNGIKAHAERVKLLWTPRELVTVLY